ncbi:MFS transporter [Geminicoccus roseus]|uniref:MFS transporter n=1 Tax=Geminicoccus roseus TaxID=404900 RepID=UPI00146FBA03|nr:MFS transporter [Geminicoccus roseus]
MAKPPWDEVDGVAAAMIGDWVRIGWFYAIGVLAAAQLGKMSALLPLIEAELALGLTLAAALVSLLELGGATLGLLAGTLAATLGRRRTLLWGIALLAGAGIGEALAGSPLAMMAWRAVESLGYLAIVIAAPLMIFHTARPHQRSVALALWSSFVPVGLALGAILSGFIAELFSWRTALLCAGAAGVVAWLVTLALPGLPAREAAPGKAIRPGAAAWALAAAFGCYTMFEVGMLALLPTFLVERAGASAALAGLLTGIAAFVTLLGSIVAAWHSRRPREARLLLPVAILLPAAMLFLVFHDQPDLALVASAAIALNGISGIFPGLAFAMLPQAAGSEAGMAGANGLLTQFGAAGSLVGPPLFAACVTAAGWPGAALTGATASLGCFLLMRLAQAGVRLRNPSMLTGECR